MDLLGAMQTFVRVVDAGSFSAAARHMSVGQSAVSKIVAQLEDHLGATLLVRSTRSLALSAAGEKFYARAVRTLREVSEAEAEARGATSAATGKLRVSASVCFARIHVLPRLPEFLAMHPQIDIDVITDDRIVNLVEEGEIGRAHV